jgi:Fe-S oxidoreductase
MYGPELVRAFGEFKAVWDPGGRMNPGKVVDPYPITSNLRLGADYHPKQVSTKFAYPDDDHDFSRAALRCVGVGKCRHDKGGVMCPSYMVTREEEHSTRGRARLLFEMLNGEEIADGWRSEAVKDALDLCLACKGCKSDCPVNVDMATYKAEFMYHHYKGRLRPRQAYSIGLIWWAARLASKAPWAHHLLRQVLDDLRPLLRQGVPLVGLEPSCLAVFRDELRQLLPHDHDANRLAQQSYTLAELLAHKAPSFAPRLAGRAIVQRHCHHHAVMGFTHDQQLLERMGLQAELLDSGCCGMAGSFGLEPGDHYQIASKQGERVLLPRVRQAPPDTLVLADGFSCRTQIQQGSDRHPLHLAEALHLAMGSQ